jgi:hypothetical protein
MEAVIGAVIGAIVDFSSITSFEDWTRACSSSVTFLKGLESH